MNASTAAEEPYVKDMEPLIVTALEPSPAAPHEWLGRLEDGRLLYVMCRAEVLVAQAGSTPTDAVLGGLIGAAGQSSGWDFGCASGDGELLLIADAEGYRDGDLPSLDELAAMLDPAFLLEQDLVAAEWPTEDLEGWMSFEPQDADAVSQEALASVA